MNITILTGSGQMHKYFGTYNRLYNNDWNEIIGKIIDSEEEYETSRHKEDPSEEEEVDGEVF